MEKIENVRRFGKCKNLRNIAGPLHTFTNISIFSSVKSYREGLPAYEWINATSKFVISINREKTSTTSLPNYSFENRNI